MFKKWTKPKNLEILEVFRKGIFDQLSIADIERKIKLSHHPTFRRIKQLEEEKIIHKTNFKYELNLKNPETIEALFFLSMKEKAEFIESFKNDIFKQLNRQFLENNELDFVILFGSYARNQHRKTSDMDFFIISEKRRVDRSFEDIYGVKASIIFATKDEFVKMLKDRKKIIRDVLTEGIVFKGNIYYLLAENYQKW